MRCLKVFMIVMAAAPAFAQEAERVLPDTEETHKLLYGFLQAEAQKHFDVRRKVVTNLKSPADIIQRQQYLRQKFLAALGDFPEKTPLNPSVVGTLQGDGFRVEKVIYESRPSHHVTANFYIPDGKGPFPGVLLPCGHSTNGKAAEAYQRTALLMARNGLAVLCYDPIGQGERLQLVIEGKPGIPGSTSEHTMVGIGALLVGRSTASYRIWDGIRSLDYLASRPEVDPKKLGCTGNSGGGTLTAYLMALDDRIVAAAPSCYITSLEKLFATIGPQDAEQNITGQVAFGMEHADYLTMRAPRPTLLAVATHDFFDIQGAWTTFREASLVYGRMGHGERVALFEYEDKHGFTKPRREAAMRWMRRWLLGRDDAPSETDFPVFKDGELQCTRSGQVLEDFKGKSVFHLNAERARELADKRAKSSFGKDHLPKVRRLLALPDIIEPANTHNVAPVARGDYGVNLMTFETEQGMLVPARLFLPGKVKKQELVVHVNGDGMERESQPGGPFEKTARSGQRLLALDLRGLGETSPAKPAGWASHFGHDWKEAFLGVHLARPLLGQRVRDLLSVLNALPKEHTEEVHLVAVGTAGPIALHAAALDGRIKKLTLEKSLISWNNVVRTPISMNQLTNVVPGVLEHYDLPEMAEAFAPRTLTIRHPVDAAQKRVSTTELEQAYRGCKERYAQMSATERLVFE